MVPKGSAQDATGTQGRGAEGAGTAGAVGKDGAGTTGALGKGGAGTTGTVGKDGAAGKDGAPDPPVPATTHKILPEINKLEEMVTWSKQAKKLIT